MNGQGMEDFYGAETILYDTMTNVCHYTLVKT
jgi:hypothetical protein